MQRVLGKECSRPRVPVGGFRVSKAYGEGISFRGMQGLYDEGTNQGWQEAPDSLG